MQAGFYTKIGREVLVHVYLRTIQRPLGSGLWGNAQILLDLPFASPTSHIAITSK
jgi:hypothetical protein